MIITLYLKLIVAFVLAAIPFVLHAIIKHKKAQTEKWNNILRLAESKVPSMLRVKRVVFAWLLSIYRKMKFSEYARKLFTYSLVAVMLLVQAVVYCLTDFSAFLQTSSLSSEFLLLHIAGVYQQYSIHVLQAYLHLPYQLSFVVAVSLFQYRISDNVLTILHNKKQTAFLLFCLGSLMDVLSCGLYFVLAVTLTILIIGALIYPNFSSDERDKWRARWIRKSMQSMDSANERQIQKAA